MDDPIAALDQLADWSEWVALAASASAPRLPGVYRVREGRAGPLVYVGLAGPRAGSGTPQGLRGRLGRALTSGLGEALADRALADPVWLRQRLAEAEAGRPLRAKDWGRATIERADPARLVGRHGRQGRGQGRWRNCAFGPWRTTTCGTAAG